MSTPTAVTQRLCLRDVTGTATTLPTCHRRTLADLPDGVAVTVLGVCDDAHPEVARRLFDLGFMPGAQVTRLRHAPLGDPIVVRVADYEIAVRRAQAACIVIAGDVDPLTRARGARPGPSAAECGVCGR